MIFIPDPASAIMDPFFKLPTLSLTCDIVDAITKQPYSRDPRTIAAKAEAYLKSTGIGDTSYFGPEPEFFVFDEVRYSEGPNRSSYMVDSIEGRWNTDREEGPNLGYKPPHKGGYFPVPPTDTLHDLRADGKIGAIGAGVNRAGTITDMLDRFELDLFLVAGPYTLVDQEILPTELARCYEAGIRVVIGAAFYHGLLATGVRHRDPGSLSSVDAATRDRIARLEEACDRSRVPLPAAALQFGNDVAPEIGRGRIAVQQQHRRSLAALVIGHGATQHIDGLFGERLFCHLILASGICQHGERLDRAQMIEFSQYRSPSLSSSA